MGIHEPDKRHTDTVINEISRGDLPTETYHNSSRPILGTAAYTDEFEDALDVIAADIATMEDSEDESLDEPFNELGEEREDALFGD